MKFNKKLKKGFTLVELIVVIAIVAILAAVSVVSYLAFINSANESADVQLVKQLNTCLQADEALHGKKDWSEDYQGLTSLLESNGFIIENLTKTKSGCDMVYQGRVDENTIINRYALLKGKDVIYSETTFDESNNYRNLWIPETAEEAQTLSEAGKGVVLGSELGELTEEFVAHGSVIVNGAKVSSIKYKNSTENAQNVVIRTNSFETKVTINGKTGAKGIGDEVSHYGYAYFVDVQGVADASFNEYGTVGRLKVTKGHAVAKAGSEVFCLMEVGGIETIDTTVETNAIVYGQVTNLRDADGNTGADCSVEKGEDGVANGYVKVCAEHDIKNMAKIITDDQYAYYVCRTCGYTLKSSGIPAATFDDEVSVAEHIGEKIDSEDNPATLECNHAHFEYELSPQDKQKHILKCADCGKKFATENHTYDAEHADTCLFCEYVDNEILINVVADSTALTESTVHLSDGITAYNESTASNKNFVIELEPGNYNIPVSTYWIDQTKLNSGNTLTIRAKNMATAISNWDVRLIPTGVTNTGNLYYFAINGCSGYSNGGAIRFEGLYFDMSDTAYADSSYSSARLFAVYCGYGSESRYAHNITIDNCKFDGCGGKFASAVGANTSDSSPSAITISNCIGDKLNCWFNGYLADNSGFGLALTNLTSTNFLCALNNQSSAPTITLNNVDGSFLYGASGDGFSTEFAVVYTIGGAVNMENCDISILAKPNTGKKGPAYINTNAKDLSGDLTITCVNCNFSNNTGVNIDDVYITGFAGHIVTINGAQTTSNANSFAN